MAGHEPHPGAKRLRGRRWAFLLGGGAAAAGILILYAGLIEPYRVRLEETEVTVSGLPGDLDGLRILQVSDMESSHRGRREALVEEIGTKVRPDLVVVTGDLVAKWLTGERRHQATEEAADLLASLESPLGTWFVEGHGERVSLDARREIRRALDARGIHYLKDKVETISVGEARLSIVGLGLHGEGGQAPIRQEPGGLFVQDGSAGPSGPSAYLNLTGESLELPGDYELSGQMWFSSEQSGAGLTFHNLMPAGKDRFYRFRRWARGKEMHLSPHGTVFSEGRSTYGAVTRPGTWYGLRIRVETSPGATRVKARIWPAASPEPDLWGVDCLDATESRLRGGTVGLWASGPGRKEFRRLALTSGGESLGLLPGEGGGGRWRPPRAPDYMLALSEEIPRGSWPLVLSHVPDVAPYAAAMGWPFVMAGHTQGGQIRLPFIGALTTDSALGPEMAAGLFQVDGTRLYISRGIGTTRVPFRFLTPPEVGLITLRRGRSAS